MQNHLSVYTISFQKKMHVLLQLLVPFMLCLYSCTFYRVLYVLFCFVYFSFSVLSVFFIVIQTICYFMLQFLYYFFSI